jgi:hypothetical protein
MHWSSPLHGNDTDTNILKGYSKVNPKWAIENFRVIRKDLPLRWVDTTAAKGSCIRQWTLVSKFPSLVNTSEAVNYMKDERK